MTTSEHYKKTITLAWPVMLGQLGHVFVGLADSVMIGQLGTHPLAASAFANSIFAIPLVFGMGVAYGITPPIAKADGENKAAKAGKYFKHALVSNSAIALLIFAVVFILSSFTHLFGQASEVVDMSSSYLLLITSSIFPLMLFLTFKQFAEGLSDTRFAMFASIGANLINIFLNYLLIHGHWGFPQLGLDGAGYATIIARIIMALAMFIYVFGNKKFIPQLKFWRQKRWHRMYFQKLLSIGIPSGMQYIFEVSAFAFAAILAGYISAKALAAHQIAISLASISYMAASGLGASASVRVGNQLGKKDWPNLKQAGYSSFILSLIFMAVWGLIFYVGRNYFPTFYSIDTEVISLASKLLIIAVLFQLSDGLQVAALGALRGMADVKVPTIITFISYWVLGIGGAYWLGIEMQYGAEGIWYSLALALTVSAILLSYRFKWKSNRLMRGIDQANF